MSPLPSCFLKGGQGGGSWHRDFVPQDASYVLRMARQEDGGGVTIPAPDCSWKGKKKKNPILFKPLVFLVFDVLAELIHPI